jgi:hypothetical protein
MARHLIGGFVDAATINSNDLDRRARHQLRRNRQRDRDAGLRVEDCAA